MRAESSTRQAYSGSARRSRRRRKPPRRPAKSASAPQTAAPARAPSTLAVPSARSSGDRACASGAQGRWFDSSRAHTDRPPHQSGCRSSSRWSRWYCSKTGRGQAPKLPWLRNAIPGSSRKSRRVLSRLGDRLPPQPQPAPPALGADAPSRRARERVRERRRAARSPSSTCTTSAASGSARSASSWRRTLRSASSPGRLRARSSTGSAAGRLLGIALVFLTLGFGQYAVHPPSPGRASSPPPRSASATARSGRRSRR